ncbi:MAG TPA: methyltransferase domain-containing protein [Gemmataceae bacterium]|nr:methyltransferase domain-containing protein [Gemmataceae bacterium]
MDKHKLFGFTDVDQTNDPEYFIRFLDEASADESFQAYKQHSFALLELESGQHVLDVGCGTGEDARTMAQRVAPGGRVVAMDGSQSMIATARQRAEGCGLPVEFQVGDIHQLPFADNSFDAARADRIFMHLESPAQALREMMRVVRPGGRVLVYEVDFETLTVDHPDRQRSRAIVNTWCDGFRNGWLGRHIPSLFRETGMDEVRITPATLWLRYPVAMQMIGPATVERACAAGLLTSAEGEDWLLRLQERYQAGLLFCTLTGFLVLGRKPGNG